MTTATDYDDLLWMRRALDLARTVMYTTAPNPRVGCVIVRDGRVLGEGATQPPGGARRGVRLARCPGPWRDGGGRHPLSRWSRAAITAAPPCVDAVLAAAPRAWWWRSATPIPGQRPGACALRAAGIAVTTGVCQEEALALNAGFISRMSRGLPWVWMKMAASLDGRSALHNGMSQWITGPQAREDGHRCARAAASC